MPYFYSKPRKLKKKDVPFLRATAIFFAVLAFAAFFLFPKAKDDNSLGENVLSFWIFIALALFILIQSFFIGAKKK